MLVDVLVEVLVEVAKSRYSNNQLSIELKNGKKVLFFTCSSVDFIWLPITPL